MATRSTSDVLKELREPFPVEAVKQREGGGGKKLDYIAIETVLARLLDVAPAYSWLAKVVSFEPASVPTRDGPKPGFAAVVSGDLTAGDKTATGVGFMANQDGDMAVKSANSEAMKNAAKNGFGVGLELWDAEYRAQLDKRRKLAKGSAATLKQEVFKLAIERTGKPKPTAKDIATLFGVTPGDLADEDTLAGILRKEGLL